MSIILTLGFNNFKAKGVVFIEQNNTRINQIYGPISVSLDKKTLVKSHDRCYLIGLEESSPILLVGGILI